MTVSANRCMCLSLYLRCSIKHTDTAEQHYSRNKCCPAGENQCHRLDPFRRVGLRISSGIRQHAFEVDVGEGGNSEVIP